MRETARRRFAFALLVALLGWAALAIGNPLDHVRADLRADGKGFKLSLEIAANAIEQACPRA